MSRMRVHAVGAASWCLCRTTYKSSLDNMTAHSCARSPKDLHFHTLRAARHPSRPTPTTHALTQFTQPCEPVPARACRPCCSSSPAPCCLLYIARRPPSLAAIPAAPQVSRAAPWAETQAVSRRRRRRPLRACVPHPPLPLPALQPAPIRPSRSLPSLPSTTQATLVPLFCSRWQRRRWRPGWSPRARPLAAPAASSSPSVSRPGHAGLRHGEFSPMPKGEPKLCCPC